MDIKQKDDRELLEETYKLAKENNHMLHAQRRAAFIGGIVKTVVWLLLFIVVPYYIYVIYLQPYLEQITAAYQGIEEKTAPLENLTLPEGFDLQKLLQQFGGGQ